METVGAGNAFTVMIFVAYAVVQELLWAYLMVSMPAETPVTAPADDTVACAFVALHVPPDTELARVVLEPLQSIEAPVITPVSGISVSAGLEIIKVAYLVYSVLASVSLILTQYVPSDVVVEG